MRLLLVVFRHVSVLPMLLPSSYQVRIDSEPVSRNFLILGVRRVWVGKWAWIAGYAGYMVFAAAEFKLFSWIYAAAGVLPSVLPKTKLDVGFRSYSFHIFIPDSIVTDFIIRERKTF